MAVGVQFRGWGPREVQEAERFSDDCPGIRFISSSSMYRALSPVLSPRFSACCLSCFPRVPLSKK